MGGIGGGTRTASGFTIGAGAGVGIGAGAAAASMSCSTRVKRDAGNSFVSLHTVSSSVYLQRIEDF